MTTTTPQRDAMVTEHIEMARRVAGKVARRASGLIDRREAEAAAMLGLVEAADRFDPTRGIPFVAFAAPRIRGAVLDELRRGDPATRRCRSAARKLAEAERAASCDGQAATSDLASSLGLSEDELDARRLAAEVPDLVPFDEARGDAGPAPSRAPASQRLAMVREALERLPERDLQVLSMYYRDGLQQKQIGAILGVTESRVCQILARGRDALRAQLAD